MAAAIRAALAKDQETELGLHALRVAFDPQRRAILVLLSSGYEVGVALELIPGLEGAPKEMVNSISLDPQGMVLLACGRPVISLSAILEGLLGTRTWMASLMPR